MSAYPHVVDAPRRLDRALASSAPLDRVLGAPDRLPLPRSARSWLARLPLARLIRCFGVSVFTTLLSLSLLACFTQTGLLAPAVGNVVATLAGIFPSYALNRRWVWKRTGRSDLGREVLPFWTLNVTALVVSTLAVGLAAGWAGSVGLTGTARTLVVLAANVTAFGALWVVQFLVLDRLLFARRIPKDRA